MVHTLSGTPYSSDDFGARVYDGTNMWIPNGDQRFGALTEIQASDGAFLSDDI